MPDQPVAPNAEARMELRRALALVRTLPVEYREPLMLAASGISYAEIARVLNVSVSTAKIRVHRARLKLVSATTSSPGSSP